MLVMPDIHSDKQKLKDTQHHIVYDNKVGAHWSGYSLNYHTMLWFNPDNVNII